MNFQYVSQNNFGGGFQVNIAVLSIGNPTLNFYLSPSSQALPGLMPNPAAAGARQPDNYN